MGDGTLKKEPRPRNSFTQKITKTRGLCFPNETLDSLLLLSFSLVLFFFFSFVYRLTFCISYFFGALQKKECSFKPGLLSGKEYGSLTWQREQHNFYCLFYSRIQVGSLKSEPFSITKSTNTCNCDFFSACFVLCVHRHFL